MPHRVLRALVSFSLLLLLAAGGEFPTGAGPFPTSPSLQQLVDRAVAAARTLAPARSTVSSNDLAVTLVDLRDLKRPVAAGYRSEVQIYPASVIKLFYLAAAHRWMEDGRLADTPELRRAMKDMIVESYNEATHYIVDLLTGTTSGPELPERELDEWFDKRNAVNRYFASLGYKDVVANKKPWCEGPYGRESQSIRRHQPNRNWLTTDDTARLMVEMVTGRAVNERRSGEMMALMKRDPFKPLEGDAEPDQGNAFTGLALRQRSGAKLWSKAGWTSRARHDSAYVELPGGARFVLVTFTEGHANDRSIIEAVARTVVDGLTIGADNAP